jgi:hypothetical protein
MTLQTAPTRRADPADDRPPSRQAVLVAVAAGLGYMCDAYVVNLYSFVLPLVTGAMAAQIGSGNVARWFALIWVFLIAGYLIGPDTRGRSLAELDAVGLRSTPFPHRSHHERH